MRLFKKLTIILFLPISAFAFSKDTNAEIQNILQQHYKKYKEVEYFSGVSLAVLIPGHAIEKYYIGTVSHEINSKPITADSLFQIGSITKSFTAAILLRLEAEKKLSTKDSLSKWLHDYPKWGSISITSLLNMTSGLPNYSDIPLWNAAILQKPTQEWKNDELISYAYPRAQFSPPLKSGYFYTNTAYILAGLIAEKAANQSLQTLMSQLITAAKLENTFYPTSEIQRTLAPRMVRGYNYNQYDNPSLIGSDITNFNLSWAGAAGAIISNPEDIIKWAQGLFVGEQILSHTQKNELMKLISIKDGKPIQAANTHQQGFGLGVVQGYNPKVGHYWFYEGETLGYRAFYMYVPCNEVIIAAIFNSAVNNENDHGSDLIINIYHLLVKKHTSLQCDPREA